MYESFQANYVKSINMDIYRKLEYPIARQMFRLLDKRFYHDKPTWRFKLREFAGKIGLSDSYQYESKIKEVLKKSLSALEREGVIKEEKRYEPTDVRGEHWILFSRGGYESKRGASIVTLAANAETVCEDAPDDTRQGLLEELVKRGVKRPRALELIKNDNLSADDLEAAIGDFDKKRKEGYFKKGKEKAGGWLYKRVRDGQAPAGYISKAKKKAQKEKKEQAKSLREAKHNHHAKKGEERRLEYRTAVKHHLAGLSATEREEFYKEVQNGLSEKLKVDAFREGIKNEESRGSTWYYLVFRHIEGLGLNLLSD